MKLPLHSENVEEEEYLFYFFFYRLWFSGSILFVLHCENVEEEEYFFSSVNVEANIWEGKYFLRKLKPEHAEEEKFFFFYISQWIIGCDSAGRSCLFRILKLPIHSKNVEKEEYFFFFCKREANIRLVKEFLLKLPFHFENVKEEEYLFSLV